MPPVGVLAIILLDKQIITSETIAALLLMTIASTMLSIPVVHRKLGRLQSLVLKTR